MIVVDCHGHCCLKPLQFLVLLSHLSIRAMASAADRFQAPNPTASVDQGKLKKLAQRVEETLSTETLYPEPKQLDPNVALVSPLNRLGASPNVHHVHYGILKSFQKNSYDRTRPAIGICVEYRSEQGMKKLMEHNRRFSQGNKLLPQIPEGNSAPLYGSLACTHLNLAFRAIKNGTPSPIGALDTLMSCQALKEVVLNGHRWWVLPETVAPERQIDISLWRNQDQNENQQTHELEVLQTIKFAAESFLKTGKDKVSLGDLVAAAQKRNPAKISPTTWLTLGKYYIGFLENGVVDLIEDLHEYHSNTVDPRELCVSMSFFGLLDAEPALKKCPQVRHYLVCTQYTNENEKAQVGGPSVSLFLENAQITALCKKPDVVHKLEKAFRDLKTWYLPHLEKALGPRVARLEITVYMTLLIRCLFCKAWPQLEPRVTLPVGKFSEEKIQALGVHWAKVMDLKHPPLGFAQAVGLQDEVKDDPMIQQEVDLDNLRSLRKTNSNGPEPEAPKFKAGDEVTLVRRMSWNVPLKGKPKFRKDVPEGLEGVVEGWADPEMRSVLVKVNLTLEGKEVSITQAVSTRNLKLKGDILPSKAEEASEVSCGSKLGAGLASSEEHHKDLKHVLGDAAPADVKVEDKWKSLLADGDELNKCMWLRSNIGTGLQALFELLPKYSDKDFIMVNRKTDKGLWKSELWTKRDFEPLEIQLAPFSSQIKDTHLMATAHAVVTLPKHGRGSHPTNGSFALDGRSRNMIARIGVVDKEEHHGSLFWVITRTSETKEVNLELHLVAEHQDEPACS